MLIQAPGIAAITAATRRPLADAEGVLNPHASAERCAGAGC
jgi:hypothetical protein